MRAVSSWVGGRHMPRAISDGYVPDPKPGRPWGMRQVWRCQDCGLLLTSYRMRSGRPSLRHHPRRKS